MADKNAEVAVEDNGGMKKTLSLWNFFTIGFGAIIGTGWVLQVGDWMVVGGGPVPAMIAFLLGAIFLVPVGAVFGELTAAIPISGGIVEYVDRSFGRTMSYITGWLLALGNGILCPWEPSPSRLSCPRCSAACPALSGCAPSSSTPSWAPTLPVPDADRARLCNLRYLPQLPRCQLGRQAPGLPDQGSALRHAARYGCLAVHRFAGTRHARVLPGHRCWRRQAATEGTSLFAGIVSVLVLTPFFYAGFDTIPQQAEEAAEGLNWNKFGKIISLALLAAGGFYMVCIYSFGTILDWHEFVKSPVPALACLKGINMLLYLAMLVIATLGPMGPMNSFYGATSRIMLAMGRKGQLPEKFAEVDPKSGAPKLACVVLASSPSSVRSWARTCSSSDQRVGSRLHLLLRHGRLACLRMRFTEPDLPRPYEVPGGKFGIGLAIAACAIIIGLLVIPFSPASLNMVEWSIVIGWLAIGLALMLSPIPAKVTPSRGDRVRGILSPAHRTRHHLGSFVRPRPNTASPTYMDP